MLQWRLPVIAGVLALAVVLAAASGCGDSGGDSSSAKDSSSGAGAAAVKAKVDEVNDEMKAATDLIGACEQLASVAGDWQDVVEEADPSQVTEEQREALGEYSQAEDCIESNVAEMREMSSELLALRNELEKFSPAGAEQAGNLVGP